MDGTTLRVDLTLPLAWHEYPAFPPQTVREWMRANLALLTALASLESVHRDGDGEARSDPTLARVEAKIDLALVLLGEWLRRQQPLPPETRVGLSGGEIEWAGPPLAAGARGRVDLYLSSGLPWPLRLPVEVSGTEDGRVRARLLHLSPDVQDWLDRTLFRYHRRSLTPRAR